ncbi:hypothetical protein [Silvanigrella aquatica]|uniref:Uncharacterized protein n=1 Tax=Silvanigrella aquatica TaxID=1915309 RepID=A0A1L4D1G6_9BACT|nr:hypothetical protein [Silvanigrella aquatica]APJ04037.1 hypothetical protein AXG55_09005 [Silvanigrella aquatica]
MMQVMITNIEEDENEAVFYKAQLLQDGKLLDGDVKFPRKLRAGEDKIGNVYELKTQNIHYMTNKHGHKSFRATPVGEHPNPVKKFMDCNRGQYCSVLPCNCLRKAG